MKTPEKIKWGLVCCRGRSCGTIKVDCPYEGMRNCDDVLLGDALALIRQLEAERDAALDPIRGDCAYCAYLPGDTITNTCFDCANKGYYRWAFRDGQEDEDNEDT